MESLKIIIIFLVVAVLLPNPVDNCGCGDGHSKRKKSGDMSSMATLMIAGLLLTQQATAQQVGLGSSLPVQQVPNLQRLNAGAPALAENIQLIAKVRALRQQNGFGFLWGKKRARILKTVAEAVNSTESSPTNTSVSQPAESALRLRTWPWRQFPFQKVNSVSATQNRTKNAMMTVKGWDPAGSIGAAAKTDRIKELLAEDKWDTLMNHGPLLIGV